MVINFDRRDRRVEIGDGRVDWNRRVEIARIIIVDIILACVVKYNIAYCRLS